MYFGRYTLALSGAIVLAFGATGQGNDLDIDDLPRSSSTFKYYQLGRHVPPRSGWADYIGGRSIIHPTMGLPLEIEPTNGEHMFCNTQVWGFKKNGQPTGKSNHLRNYSFPWTSTFCERRWSKLQRTRACGRSRPLSHQGSDCRPPAPKADHYWMVAVEDGKITFAKRNEIHLIGVSGIKWKYRHGGTPRSEIRPKGGRGVTVTKGTRLAKVTDLKSTPIHLHLESERPAFSDRDNMPSLILAYQRALGVPETPQSDGGLKFDGRYEIAEGTVVEPCSGSEGNMSIGTEQIFNFKSFWCHNRSIMGLVEDGAQRKLVYFKPRSGIREATQRNPVLFEGSLADGDYQGKALWFSKQCGDRPFDVAGQETTSAGVQLISLEGKRPSFSRQCAQTRLLNERMTFTFMRNADGVEVSQPADDVADKPVQKPDIVADAKPEQQPDVTPVQGPCAETASSASIGTEAKFSFSSLWCHNRSIVGLVEDDGRRKLIYIKPKESIREAAQRDSILFEGTWAGGEYEGEALWFNKRCGDRRFDVVGSETATAGVRLISLRGMRPSFRRGCSARPRYMAETLSFSFIRDMEPQVGPVTPDAQPGETDEAKPAEEIVYASCAGSEGNDGIGTERQYDFKTLWCHNRSIMGLVEDGSWRKLVYYKPKASVRKAAKRNPILFAGTVDDGDYRGVAIWFSQRCGDRWFDVSGKDTTTGEAQAIVLQGKRPSFSEGCEQPDLREEKLVFSIIGTPEEIVGPSGPSGTEPVVDGDDFTLAKPVGLDSRNKMRLYSTFYYVYQGTDSDHSDATALRNTRFDSFGVSLRRVSWCKAAVEGTVRVDVDTGSDRSFNYARKGRTAQTSCRGLFHPSVSASAVARTLWLELPANARFGFGNSHKIRLVPFRSIAADQKRTRLKRGTVLFIPRLNGLTFTTSDGRTLTHDGYVYVADVGGAIRGSHIDFFSGLQTTNPFPGLIKSVPSGKFDAFIITDRSIRDELDELHRR